jgi:hypothetical protein
VVTSDRQRRSPGPRDQADDERRSAQRGQERSDDAARPLVDHVGEQADHSQEQHETPRRQGCIACEVPCHGHRTTEPAPSPRNASRTLPCGAAPHGVRPGAWPSAARSRTSPHPGWSEDTGAHGRLRRAVPTLQAELLERRRRRARGCADHPCGGGTRSRATAGTRPRPHRTARSGGLSATRRRPSSLRGRGPRRCFAVRAACAMPSEDAHHRWCRQARADASARTALEPPDAVQPALADPQRGEDVRGVLGGQLVSVAGPGTAQSLEVDRWTCGSLRSRPFAA